MNVLKTEMRRGICSWKFAGSVVLILLMGLVGAGDSFSLAESYLQMDGSLAGLKQAGWILLQGASQSELFLIAVSMTAAFSYASVFYEEAENRFVLMSLSRTSYKAYIGTKVLVTAVFWGMLCHMRVLSSDDFLYFCCVFLRRVFWRVYGVSGTAYASFPATVGWTCRIERGFLGSDRRNFCRSDEKPLYGIYGAVYPVLYSF